MFRFPYFSLKKQAQNLGKDQEIRNTSNFEIKNIITFDKPLICERVTKISHAKDAAACKNYVCNFHIGIFCNFDICL